MEGGKLLDLPWMFSSGDGVATGDEDLHPIALVQCRFSEGILQPPGQDKEKLEARCLSCPTPRGAGWIIPLGVGQNPIRACHGLLNGTSPWSLQVQWCGGWTPQPLLYH